MLLHWPQWIASEFGLTQRPLQQILSAAQRAPHAPQ
jgi:hypothetical protein